MTNAALRLVILFSALLLLQACTNSSVVISPLYNRLDDQLVKGFSKQAKFTEEQTADYRSRVKSYHFWHRRTQLPAYGNLLMEMQSSVKDSGRTTLEEVTRWMNTTETFTQALRECHPVNFSNEIIRSLTDEQLSAMQTRWTNMRTKHRKKYTAETPEQRVDRRQKNIQKWASRIGLEFNKQQRTLLRQTLADQISLRHEYFSLSDQWREGLFQILNQRDSDDLDERMENQLSQLWHLLESAHPVQWRQNRALWAKFGHQFIGSLTRDQRTYVTIWVRKMARTLFRISKKRVAIPDLSGDVGCATVDGA